MQNDARGSQWRKWDFHIHTPYSILENNYDINLDRDDSEFDRYVVELFTKAIEKNVCAIGITDYFSIEGYKRIKEEYLNDPDKMVELFPNETTRQKISSLYLFPNIELRTNDFIGRKAHSLNYHVIFSGDTPIEDIEGNFLNCLTFEHTPKAKLHINKCDIEKHGVEVKKGLEDERGSDYLVGLRHITVAREHITSTLEQGPFEGHYIIAIPVDEDLSKVSWNGRDYSTKRGIYSECNCYLTSNPGTIKWALAKGREEEQIREIGSLKPCIWGSDAHSFERMFEPAEQRYCWLKCDPTFEGLKQVLYEPAERVKIQTEKPDSKDPHKIIDSIVFTDSAFQREPIYFNENLNCIIGGKSTGKSLLVRSLADAIDHRYASDQERSAQLPILPSICTSEVTWRDGTTEKRKIIYIPQTYLNRIVDNPEKQTEINRIIESVVIQDPEKSDARKSLQESVFACTNSNREKIHQYILLQQDIAELDDELKESGTPEQFEKVIETNEAKRKAIAAQISVTDEEFKRYSELEVEKRKLQELANTCRRDLEAVESMGAPDVVFAKYFIRKNSGEISHDFTSFSDATKALLFEVIRKESKGVAERWDAEQSRIETSISETLKKTADELEAVQAEAEVLRQKVIKTEELKQLTKIIESERERLLEASARRDRRAKLASEAAQLKSVIIESQAILQNMYLQYCVALNKTPLESTRLQFEAQVIWRLADFSEYLRSALNNRSFGAFKLSSEADLADLKPSDYNKTFLSNLWNALNNPTEQGGLPLKAGQSLESVLSTIFGDWYNVHYQVLSDKDTIESMSPGKKGLVLLELLIGLDEEKCPILIDQPEDDLDNRSIYKDLVDYIRKRKHERQIIIVTHNANVVLGSDSEEVIIANQEGDDAKNEQARFEYRSGSIENNMPLYDEKGETKKGVLNKEGIQTQICDILEGGFEAFEQRRNKYTSSNGFQKAHTQTSR